MDYAQSQQITAGVVGSRLGQTRDVPQQPSPVQLSQSSLDSQIKALHESLNTLEDRLRPVLAQVPEGKGNPNNGAPIASSVAARIAQSADSVADATQRVMRLLDRLEV